MRITPNGQAAILLVDPAVNYFTPIPASVFQQRLTTYQIDGGPELVLPRGGTQPITTPQLVLIDQATDAAAQTILERLGAAVLDRSAQPMQVDWDDRAVWAAYDGKYWIAEISTPEVSPEFPGRIRLTLQMRRVVAYTQPTNRPLFVTVNGGAPSSVLGGPIP